MIERKTLYRILLLFPLLFGVIGFLAVDHLKLLDALFNCVQMYVLNYGEKPTNLLVEIARWTAPLATAGSILILVASANQYIKAKIKTMLFDSVAVYGPEGEVATLLTQLGVRGIRGNEKLLPARNYILLDTQDKNLAFYEAHKSALQKAQIYLRCDSVPAQSVVFSNIHLIKPSEITARLFWKSDRLLKIAEEKKYQLNIAFIGFGELGEELLYWGLQNNIFSPVQKISYHIFADTSDFQASHPMLNEIADPIVKHDERWQNELSVLKDADLILVMPQENSMALETAVCQLLSLIHEKPITVLTDAPVILSILDGQKYLRIFSISDQTLCVENIMQNDLIYNAMRVNLRYAHIYSNVEENDENARKEWEKLNGFLRYSNISAADYHEIRKMMLQHMHAKPDGSDLSDEQMELLAELEHMRWCRYHWLNNWQYGEPKNGKLKDDAQCIHKDLVPYQDLPDSEKEKDKDTVGVMLGL